MEKRSTGGVQAQGRTVKGYAAIFNAPADLGDFQEQIASGAFRSALAEAKNIRALYNHNSSAILGTTQAKTLELREDSHGLAFTLHLPATTIGNDVAELVQRGDVAGCSFGFFVKPNGERWEKRSGKHLRTLTDLELLEVTLTADPVYQDTTVALRSKPQERNPNLMWLEVNP